LNRRSFIVSQPLIVTFLLAVILLVGYGWLRLLRRLDAANGANWGGCWLNRLDGLNRIFCRRFHGLHGDTIDLPEKGPALVVSNHVSGLDPLLLIAASRRPLRFIIASEQYHRFGLTWLFRAVGCIPVDRRGRPERAYREALRALEVGEVVALFPHGGIRLDTDPARPLKPGVVRMASLARCPIFPVRLEGIRGRGLVVASVFLPSKAHIVACPPIACEALAREECLARIAACIENSGHIHTVAREAMSKDVDIRP